MRVLAVAAVHFNLTFVVWYVFWYEIMIWERPSGRLDFNFFPDNPWWLICLGGLALAGVSFPLGWPAAALSWHKAGLFLPCCFVNSLFWGVIVGSFLHHRSAANRKLSCTSERSNSPPSA